MERHKSLIIGVILFLIALYCVLFTKGALANYFGGLFFGLSIWAMVTYAHHLQDIYNGQRYATLKARPNKRKR
jgi:hypothetical protein